MERREPMSDERPAPKLFLLDQRLSRLSDRVKARDRKSHVCGGGGPTEKLEGPAWEPEGRAVLVQRARGPEPRRRVALVCDAGLGKTTTLEYLRTALARPGGRQLPLLLRLDLTHHLDGLLIEEHTRPDTLR